MNSSEYAPFRTLLNQVYFKAFQEPLAPLPYSKATALSFLIEDITGQLISYKTLDSYVKATLANRLDSINPNISTLDILVQFVQNEPAGKCGLAWYHFRNGMLRKTRQDTRPDSDQMSLYL